MDDAAFTLVSKRYAEMTEVGAASSMLKHVGTKYAKNKFELLLALTGNQGLGWEGPGFTENELQRARAWLRSKGYSIESGTSEVMLNIIATRVLNLPKK
jgi:alkylation response protein AidB-like acyl-CoA dehydrogenase